MGIGRSAGRGHSRRAGGIEKICQTLFLPRPESVLITGTFGRSVGRSAFLPFAHTMMNDPGRGGGGGRAYKRATVVSGVGKYPPPSLFSQLARHMHRLSGRLLREAKTRQGDDALNARSLCKQTKYARSAISVFENNFLSIRN